MKLKLNFKLTLRKKELLPISLGICLVILIIVTAAVYFQDRFFPRVLVGDTNLSFLTKTEASELLSSKVSPRLRETLNFNYQNQTYSVNLKEIPIKVNFTDSIIEAFETGHQNLLQGFGSFFSTLTLGKTFPLKTSFSIDRAITDITPKVFTAPIDAQFSIKETLEGTSSAILVNITPGKNGSQLDKDALVKEINNFITFGTYSNYLPIKIAQPLITTEEANLAKKVLEDNNSSPVKLVYNEKSWVLDSKTLVTMLDLKGPTNDLINRTKLINYLSQPASQINQPVVEPLFKFNNSNKRVSAFKLGQEGRSLDIEKTADLITLALTGTRPKQITLPVSVIEPKIQTTEGDNLGIKELIGQGVSNFAGSIPNRIYNLSLAASRMDGVLIPKGQTFSFNNTVGDISGASGYKPAYVIKEGRTVLDDGGGVCQVSTTIFRAALNSGLPIVARTAHAYRVGYYEQGFPPGLDATVFSPSVDFKFKNDTPGNILIQAYTDGLTLYVDLYGTSDGRVSSLSTPVVSNRTPAPPELRQDDPTLPKGTVKQVDFAAAGANVAFNRVVKRNGETLISETFKSNYKPWQAIFLVGTQ